MSSFAVMITLIFFFIIACAYFLPNTWLLEVRFLIGLTMAQSMYLCIKDYKSEQNDSENE
mgnify:FL=1